MTDVASVHEALVKLNQHTAARFDKTANTLIEVLDDQDLSAWCELVLKISQSGWHSWEVLNYYLAAVPVLMSIWLRLAWQFYRTSQSIFRWHR